MYIRRIQLSLLVAVLVNISCSPARESKPPLPTAPYINLTRILGLWQVPARIPTLLDQKATEMTFLISPGSEQSFKIKWEFKKGSDDSSPTQWNLSSKQEDATKTTSWMVFPFWPIRFHYQIIEYSADYNWMVLGSNDRKHLWVLSREKTLAPELLDAILERLQMLEFDVTRVVRENAKRRG